MALVRVSEELLRQVLFGDALCKITDAFGVDSEGNFTFEIEGPDVPDSKEVTAVITERRTTIEFKSS
ncbi:MAG TPA: hypothetical protein ENH62_11015 [Marinobacter sp.]|uniref:Uncharacterized protein n=1 Tax=marine sediment metagenome TaxID=412755 RepID=A0A0F9LMH7_9ZZZZ|nr:hypothetical protein [Marinobacter sp.]